jgi:hypothetical protein
MEAHAGRENAEEDRGRSASGDEGQGRHAGRRIRSRAGGVERRGWMGAYCAFALLSVASLVARSHALPSDAPWGDTWSDGGGVLASEVRALAIFYDCTVAGDDKMYEFASMGNTNETYDAMADCSRACHAGTCERRTADGHLSAPELVTLHPNTTREREVVLVDLSPVLYVGDTLEMVIKTVDASLTISVQEDPGLPIGMVSSLNGAQSELTVSWSPHVGQEGVVHEVTPL